MVFLLDSYQIWLLVVLPFNPALVGVVATHSN